jgi:hypothetical protein
MKKLAAFLENALLIARKPVPVFVRVPAWGRIHHIERYQGRGAGFRWPYQRRNGNFRREWNTP